MPYAIRKVRNKSCYRVYNKRTRKVFAKCASKENANKQMNLLKALEYNPKFRQQIKARQQTMKRRSK
jgi:hypothetical protein